VNYIPNSRSGQDTSGVKPKGTLHWVAADQAEEAEVRLYDRLFREASPEADGDFMDALNPNSLKILKGCKVEPSLSTAEVGTIFQFTRLGYFKLDSKYSTPGSPVFNRAVTLKDGWKG
jgi:glutaminyl-tRNA synthetase